MCLHVFAVTTFGNLGEAQVPKKLPKTRKGQLVSGCYGTLGRSSCLIGEVDRGSSWAVSLFNYTPTSILKSLGALQSRSHF